jgi:hypothetical protein
MAFGPATNLVQQAVLTLLQGRNPSPVAPADLPPATGPQVSAPAPSGGFTPPGGFLPPPGPPPEPAPVAPSPAIDQSLIERLTGPRPVAPTPEPAPFIVRIARALQGFGAGVQGQGPQFLENLREQREAPMRRYEAEQNIYQNRRAQAVEFAERKQEREQDRIQRQAEQQAERDFNLYLKRTGITDEAAIAHLKQGFDLAQLRERERIADERLDKQQRLKFGEDLGAQIKFYKANGVKDPTQARRLALNDFADVAGQLGIDVPELTKADNAVLGKVGAQIDPPNRLSRGGAAVGGGSRLKAAEKAANDFEAARAAVVSAIQRGDVRAEQLHRRQLDKTFGRLQQFGDLIESGYGEGGWPYQKPRLGAPAPAPAPQQQQGPSQQRAASKAKLMAAGFGDAEAEQELNRLGIK